MFGAGDGALRPANPLSGVERAGHIPRVTGVAAAAGGSAGLAPEATAGAGAGAGAVTQAEESSLLEARQSAVRAVAHERRLRNRAVDVVADELGDDLFVEVRETTPSSPPSEGIWPNQHDLAGSNLEMVSGGSHRPYVGCAASWVRSKGFSDAGVVRACAYLQSSRNQ